MSTIVYCITAVLQFSKACEFTPASVPLATLFEQANFKLGTVEALIMLKGSIVAIVTPFKEDLSVDYQAYENLIRWHAESGTHGIVVAGTTGEAPTLSQSEVIKLVEITLSTKLNSMKVLVGNGGISTSKVIAESRAFESFPIDGFLTATPYYVKPTQEGMIQHYRSIADELSKPIYLYNVPGRTGVDLSNDSIIQLAKHQNIQGVKEASGDLTRVAELVAQTDGQFSLLSGDDPTGLDFCEMGGHGVISVTANICPRQMAERSNALDDNRLEEAKQFEGQIEALHSELFIEANPIPVKWALAEIKKIKNTLRLPLTPLASKTDKLKQLLDQLDG